MSNQTGRGGVAVGTELCESPLELKLAEALLAACDKFEHRKVDDPPEAIGWWPGWDIHLATQLQFGPYRPDFLVGPAPHELAHDDHEWLLAVEVDGHDYHERTKAQASHDRSRDRWFAARRVICLRFTGQEVYRDAEACALEVLELAMDLQKKRLDAAFSRHIEAKLGEGAKTR